MENDQEKHLKTSNSRSVSRLKVQTCAANNTSTEHISSLLSAQSTLSSEKIEMKDCKNTDKSTVKARKALNLRACQKSIFHQIIPNISRSIVTVFIFYLLLSQTHAHPEKTFNGLSRSEISREILSLFGLSRTPHPVGHPVRERQSDAAPLYMLGLYNSLSGFSELFENRIKEEMENPSDPNVAHKRNAPTTPRRTSSLNKHSSSPFSHTYPYDVRVATNSAWYRYSEAQMAFQNEIGLPDRDPRDEDRLNYDSMMSDGLEHNLLQEADVVMSITATNRAYNDDVKGAGTLLKRHRPFYFNVSQIPEDDDLIAVKFRLYKSVGQESQENTTLRVNVYQAMYDKIGRTALHLLGSKRVLSNEEGWLVFDVTSACKDWIASPDDNLGLRVAVETLKNRSQNLKKAGIVGKRKDLSKQAFLVSFLTQGTDVLPRQARERMKRNAEDNDVYEEPDEEDENEEEADDEFNSNEPAQRSKRAKRGKSRGRSGRKSKNQIHDDRTNENVACHRDALFVDFRILGWDSWIIAPAGYLAYQCLGTCRFPLTEKMNATNHAIVQTLMHAQKKNKVPIPKTCCSPTELTAISVLFYNDNNNVIFKKYKEMIVEACGCR